MTTFPDPTCRDCDAVLDIDGDDGACYYTGRACAPGGCDCGTTRTVRCPDCDREHDGAEGYAPGPELRSAHDGITLTVQRTHLHDTLAVYYWQITVEGHSIPMADGTFSCWSMAPPHAAAAEIAWQLYAGPHARTVTKSPDPLTWWNGAITPHAAATIGIMFREAWT